jgi:hypothetical protein
MTFLLRFLLNVRLLMRSKSSFKLSQLRLRRKQEKPRLLHLKQKLILSTTSLSLKQLKMLLLNLIINLFLRSSLIQLHQNL